MTEDDWLFGFRGVWHVRHADGTTEDIELTHGNLIEDAKGSVGQFILEPPGQPCEPGTCRLGTCGGQEDDRGPCGGCCSCLGGCLDEEPRWLGDLKEPTAEEMAEFERRLDETVNKNWQVAEAPSPPLTRESVKAALALYYDVDADDPETDGGERELASARRVLDKIKEMVDDHRNA